MRAVPSDPLSRFLDLAERMVEEKKFTDNRSIIRYAALTMVTAEGSPQQIAAAVMQAGRRLSERAGWFSETRSTLRYVLAALVAASGKDPARFHSACETLRARFRAKGIRRGGPYELVAAAMLHLASLESDRDVARMQRIYETMKEHHWWLTGPEDLPACAMLAVHGDDPSRMPGRIEEIYEHLRQAGQPARDGLQMASHVLYLAPGSASEVCGRFLELFEGFKKHNVAMWDNDRDELALLCMLGDRPAALIDLVLDHRSDIKARLNWVGPTTSFSYACCTAFLAARAGRELDAELARDIEVANLLMATNAAREIQEARQAAASS